MKYPTYPSLKYEADRLGQRPGSPGDGQRIPRKTDPTVLRRPAF